MDLLSHTLQMEKDKPLQGIVHTTMAPKTQHNSPFKQDMKGIKSKLGKNQVEDDLDDMVDAILKGDEDLMELVNIFISFSIQ